MCIVAKEVKEKSKVLPSMHPLRLVMKPQGKLNKLSEAKIKIFCKKKSPFFSAKILLTLFFLGRLRYFGKQERTAGENFF